MIQAVNYSPCRYKLSLTQRIIVLGVVVQQALHAIRDVDLLQECVEIVTIHLLLSGV